MQSPERINLLRLSDVALTSGGILDVTRGVFCFGPDYVEQDEASKPFSFEGGGGGGGHAAAAAPAAMDFADVAKKVATAAAFESPSKSPQ